MRKIVLVLLFTLFPLAAHGQIAGQSFVHNFGKYKVYLRINTIQDPDVSWLESARIKDNTCTEFYVQPLKISQDTLRVGSSTKWGVEETERGLRFTFPSGKKVEYKATQRDGAAICLKKTRDI